MIGILKEGRVYMNLFDVIQEKISATGNVVAKKTMDIADLTKASIKLATEEEKLDKVFSEVGKVYYEQYKDDPDVKLKGYIAQIELMKEQIEELRAMVHTLKGEQPCSQCGKATKNHAKFCSHCGTQNINYEKEA